MIEEACSITEQASLLRKFGEVVCTRIMVDDYLESAAGAYITLAIPD